MKISDKKLVSILDGMAHPPCTDCRHGYHQHRGKMDNFISGKACTVKAGFSDWICNCASYSTEFIGELRQNTWFSKDKGTTLSTEALKSEKKDWLMLRRAASKLRAARAGNARKKDLRFRGKKEKWAE